MNAHRLRVAGLCLALGAVVACSGDDNTEDDSNNNTTTDSGVGNDPADAGNTTPADSGPAPTVDAGEAPDMGVRPDAGMRPPTPECSAPEVTSPCGEQAVIRVLTRLGDGMDPVEGIVQLNLHHLRLGAGEFGGVYHIDSRSRGMFEWNSTNWHEGHFDMCAGGEMWSEDNCEYNLFAWIDTNLDGELNRGEPAGRKTMNVSCFQDGAGCHELVLDCLDGQSCVAFEADTVCACQNPTCEEQIGKIITCQ